MKHRNYKYTALGYEQAYKALVAAYVEGYSFTVQGFCSRFGFLDNRHTRAVLNQLAAEGKLFKARSLFSDGHYRVMYSAQKTIPF